MRCKKTRSSLSSKRKSDHPMAIEVTPATGASSDSQFFNRELSDLAFIERVLEESSNERHPLLERLAFLSISAMVLDQFYTVRVSRLRHKINTGITRPSVDGLTPAVELRSVNSYADHLLNSQQNSWIEIHKLLAEQDISLVSAANLYADELVFAEDYYHKHVMLVLSPFVIDREHPFPFIPSGGLCVVAEGRTQSGDITHLLVPIPDSVPRFILLPGSGSRFIIIESLIIRFIQSFFPGTEITDCGTFQILRDNDLAIDEGFDDLREMVETGLELRERANVIRLKFGADMSEEARYFVAQELGIVDKDEVETLRQSDQGIAASEYVVVDELIGLSSALGLIDKSLAPNYPDLVFPVHQPKLPDRIRNSGGDYFSVIRERDLMLHWPYDSFEVLVNFIKKASVDPDVTAIKQTLYRTSDGSPIVEALIAAAEKGKTVIAVVELEARDNEKSNVLLAKRMEMAGVHIVYGIVDLKVHCKMTLIVRREEDDTVLYSHFGTGNYHPGNARSYTDLSYFTSNEVLGRDANMVFNYLTSGSFPPCEAISVAPENLRRDILSYIDAEIENAKLHKPAEIWIKLNSLTDPALINKLYEASSSGVKVEMVVRRQCRLRPGVKGLSENIRVRSIVGRYLEHSRIYCFANGECLPHANASIFISSADGMERNFDARVEVMIPIIDSIVHQQVLEDVLQRNIEDTDQSWLLTSEGTYKRLQETGQSVQCWSLENTSRSGR